MENRESLEKCAQCGSTDLVRDYKTGELVCMECGYVASSILVDRGPEWRTFNVEQRRTRPRAGLPLTWTFYDKGLSTSIGWQGRDAYGRKLEPEQRAQVNRLRKWQRRYQLSSSTHRSLSPALSMMKNLANNLHLPRSVLETASIIYRRALHRNIIRGRSMECLGAAALYMACRQCGVIRKLKEIGKAGNLDKKQVGKTYRFLVEKLDADVPLFDIHGYVSKFISQLGLSGQTESLALKILDKAIDLRLTGGRGRSGISAAVIYIASKLTGEYRSQSEIARKAKVTEVTIRNRYKELMNEIKIIVEL